MLLLSFCGASDDEIAADYALTMEFVPPSEEAMNKATNYSPSNERDNSKGDIIDIWGFI